VDWVTAPVEQPPRIRSWGRIGAAFGSANRIQAPTWESDIYPDQVAPNALVAITGAGQITFFSPFGVLVAGQLGWGGGFVGDARLAAIWTWRRLTLGGGLGRMAVQVDELAWADGERPGEPIQRFHQLQYGHGTALVRSRLPPRVDVGTTVGLSGGSRLFELGVGWTVGKAPAEFRLGLTARQRVGLFVAESDPALRLVSSSGTLELSVEWVRGEY
jgi:hypothetical protein